MTADASHRAPSVRPYLLVFAGLMALLALTVTAAMINLGRFGIAVALSIALLKCVLILLYFMHLRSAPHRTAIVAAAGFLWLAILAALAFYDYASR